MLRRILLLNVPFSVRLAAGLWIALAVGVCGRAAFSDPLKQSVVPIYRSAGEHFLSGASLYSANPPHDVFRYPPPAAAGFAVLAVLPEKTGAILWRLFGLGAFAWGLRRFQLAAAPDLPRARVGWLWAAAAPLLLPSFNNGQGNVLLTAAMLHAAATLMTAQPWRSAGWLAFAIGLKLYPLAPAALLVLTAPKRLLPRLILAVAAAAAVPFLLQSPSYVLESYREFAGYCGTDDRQAAPIDRAPRDWTIVPRAFADVVVPAKAQLGVSAVTGMVCAGLTLLAARRGRGPEAGLMLGLLWMTVFGPATENPTYSLLAPVGGWALATARTPGRLILAVAAFLLLLAPVLRALFPTSEVVPLRTAQPAAAVLLSAVFAVPGPVRAAGTVSPAAPANFLRGLPSGTAPG